MSTGHPPIGYLNQPTSLDSTKGDTMFYEITPWDVNLKVEQDGRFHRCKETRVNTVSSIRGWDL